MAHPGKDDALNMLRGWFDRDLSRYAKWDRDVELVAFESDGTVRIKIYTDVHCFCISATPGIENRDKPLLNGERYSYLGCTASSRKPRAGEEWSRGNDLHDGSLSEATWIGILGDIISYEMVMIHKDCRAAVGERGQPVKNISADETPPTNTADKSAQGTITIGETSATAWPPAVVVPSATILSG